MPLLALLLALLATQASPTPTPTPWRDAPAAEWRPPFHGRDLPGRTGKPAHHEVGDNYAGPFRVQEGANPVRYARYRQGFGPLSGEGGGRRHGWGRGWGQAGTWRDSGAPGDWLSSAACEIQ